MHVWNKQNPNDLKFILLLISACAGHGFKDSKIQKFNSAEAGIGFKKKHSCIRGLKISFAELSR
jgi:hypothetical protein